MITKQKSEKFSKIKEILAKKRYLTTFVLSSIAIFAVLYIIMVATNSFSLNNFIEMNGSTFTILSLVSSAIISLLFGVYAALSLYKFEFMHSINGKNNATSAGGFLTALFSAGCPTCGSLLLPLIGISSLAIFPFQGLELKLASILLLGFVNVKIIENINTCKVQKEKLKLKPIISEKHDIAVYAMIFFMASLIIFNQAQIMEVTTNLDYRILGLNNSNDPSETIDLSDVDVTQINSTAMAIAMLFPVNQIQTSDDAIEIMLSSGTPEYSETLGGISFDDPINSMEYLAKWYYTFKNEVKENDPEVWERYLALAAAPRGISCEFCCGVGPQGIDAEGTLRCGCKHNPAVQSLTLGLMKYTDYSDAEVLREVMKWKAMWFPKNMVGLAMEVAGTDPSQLQELPGMVGGC